MTLEDLANKINVCATKADDYRVSAACHLATAKRTLREQGIAFKDWARENIKFSYDEARKLAKAGEPAIRPRLSLICGRAPRPAWRRVERCYVAPLVASPSRANLSRFTTNVRRRRRRERRFRGWKLAASRAGTLPTTHTTT